jgi:aldose 1-epimerase
VRVIGADYDDSVSLDGDRGKLMQGLTLRDPSSGRRLEMWTTEGVMQIYTAIHWQPKMVSRTGQLKRSPALAIEPQNIADAPNHPHFPSSILRPDNKYLNYMSGAFFECGTLIE